MGNSQNHLEKANKDKKNTEAHYGQEMQVKTRYPFQLC